MKTNPYKVAVVLDKNFGEKVAALSKKMHVWICETPVNKKAVISVWTKNKRDAVPGKGITAFKISNDDTPESLLIDEMDSIDVHHGEYSHNPPWSELHVYGVKSTSELKLKLKKFGTGRYKTTAAGFIFYRQR